MNVKSALGRTSLSSYLRTVVRLVLGLVTFRMLYGGLSKADFGFWPLLWSVFGYGVLVDFGLGFAAQKRVAELNPNIDALRWYFGEVHERLRRLVPNLEVLIVGKAPVPEVNAYGAREGVTVTGGVLGVRPHYRRSWMQIVPLRIGGGTRLKIVESMAIGTPVVSTTIGAQGLDLRHEEEILLADTPEDFARETARALYDTALREHIEMQGAKTAQDRLAWPMPGKKLSELYTARFDRGRSASPAPVRLETAIAG